MRKHSNWLSKKISYLSRLISNLLVSLLMLFTHKKLHKTLLIAAVTCGVVLVLKPQQSWSLPFNVPLLKGNQQCGAGMFFDTRNNKCKYQVHIILESLPTDITMPGYVSPGSLPL